MAKSLHQLAVVTGASTGIGLELAKCCARDGYDLVIAADEAKIDRAVENLRQFGVTVEVINIDLSSPEGVDKFFRAANWGDRVPEIFCANAGRGLGKAFLDQDIDEAQKVVDTNISGTILLLHKIGLAMRAGGQRRILITGSIAGFTPGTFQAVYNGTKAFLDSFSFALRAELDGSGVTVTCLMPGATETEFFARADMLDTKIGHAKKDDPAEVAQIGYDAMMRGDGDVVSGWKNKLMSALALVTPSASLAETHRKMAAPGSGEPSESRR